MRGCFKFLAGDHPAVDKEAILQVALEFPLPYRKRPEADPVAWARQIEFLKTAFLDSSSPRVQLVTAFLLSRLKLDEERHCLTIAQNLVSEDRSFVIKEELYQHLHLRINRREEHPHFHVYTDPLINLFESGTRFRFMAGDNREHILRVIGKLGSKAKAALPWLSEVGNKYPDYKRHASSTTSAIEQALK